MIDKELTAKARKADLPQFFRANGYMLEEIKDRKGIQFRVDNHGGLIIRDHMFNQFSTGKSGNAIECLTDVLGYKFQDAVKELNKYDSGASSLNYVPKDKESTPVEMPDRFANVARVYAYLINTRNIDQSIVSLLIQHKLLYQDINGNAIFVHKDKEGNSIGGEVQGTTTFARFKGIVAGTGKSAFEINKGIPDKVYAFESAIDAISYIQMHRHNKDENNLVYASMAGLKKEILLDYLNKGLVIHSKVDNDIAGIKFNKTVKLEIYSLEASKTLQIHTDKDHEYVFAKDPEKGIIVFPSQEDYEYFKQPMIEKEKLSYMIAPDSPNFIIDKDLLQHKVKDYNDLLKKNIPIAQVIMKPLKANKLLSGSR